MSEKYHELLKDSRWRSKRKEILHRDGNMCAICGKKKRLNVHHIFYVNGKMPWEYPNYALITLCEFCHSKWHEEHGILIKKCFSKEEHRAEREEKKQEKKQEVRERFISKRKEKMKNTYKGKVCLARQQEERNRHRKKVDGVWVVIEK